MFISYNFLNFFNSGDTERVQISARQPCQSFPGHWLLLTTKGLFAHLFLLSVFVFIKALLLAPPPPRSRVRPLGGHLWSSSRWLRNSGYNPRGTDWQVQRSLIHSLRPKLAIMSLISHLRKATFTKESQGWRHSRVGPVNWGYFQVVVPRESTTQGPKAL